MNEQQQIPIYDSQEPSEEGKQLVTLFNEMESKQLDFLDESGKSIIERIATFLAAMGAAIWAIQPRYYRRYMYNVSRLGKEFEKITRHKMFWLRVAGILFALGSVALAVLIISIIWTL